MRPFDAVILNVDLPEHKLRAGLQGAVVEAFPQAPDTFLVEFLDDDDQTIGIVPVKAHQISVTLPDLYDGELVALLQDWPSQHLVRGQVGIIQRRSAPGVYEVAFSDERGAAPRLVYLHAHQVLLLQWQGVALAER